MRCGLRSLSSARCGMRPSATASPPQNGSTSRRSENGSQSGRRCGTSQRLPPAHFKGGLTAAVSAAGAADTRSIIRRARVKAIFKAETLSSDAALRRPKKWWGSSRCDEPVNEWSQRGHSHPVVSPWWGEATDEPQPAVLGREDLAPPRSQIQTLPAFGRLRLGCNWTGNMILPLRAARPFPPCMFSAYVGLGWQAVLRVD